VAAVAVRVVEPGDATEVVAEQETVEPRDSRRSVKAGRQPRPPVTGAGRGQDVKQIMSAK